MMMTVTMKITLESGELTMMVATKMMEVALVAGRKMKRMLMEARTRAVLEMQRWKPTVEREVVRR